MLTFIETHLQFQSLTRSAKVSNIFLSAAQRRHTVLCQIEKYNVRYFFRFWIHFGRQWRCSYVAVSEEIRLFNDTIATETVSVCYFGPSKTLRWFLASLHLDLKPHTLPIGVWECVSSRVVGYKCVFVTVVISLAGEA